MRGKCKRELQEEGSRSLARSEHREHTADALPCFPGCVCVCGGGCLSYCLSASLPSSLSLALSVSLVPPFSLIAAFVSSSFFLYVSLTHPNALLVSLFLFLSHLPLDMSLFYLTVRF